jgi:hypothetical protein
LERANQTTFTNQVGYTTIKPPIAALGTDADIGTGVLLVCGGEICKQESTTPASFHPSTHSWIQPHHLFRLNSTQPELHGISLQFVTRAAAAPQAFSMTHCTCFARFCQKIAASSFFTYSAFDAVMRHWASFYHGRYGKYARMDFELPEGDN